MVTILDSKFPDFAYIGCAHQKQPVSIFEDSYAVVKFCELLFSLNKIWMKKLEQKSQYQAKMRNVNSCIKGNATNIRMGTGAGN